MRDDYKVEWSYRLESSGWMGRLETFMGPGKTRAESTAEMIGASVVLGALAWLYWRPIEDAHLPIWKVVVLIVVALDLVGGIMTNSTNAAKRIYHRNPASKGRLLFVSAHLLHLLAVGVVFLGVDIPFFVVNAVVLLAGGALMEWTSIQGKRPLSMVLLLLAIIVNAKALALPPILELFPTLFYLKMFVCFLNFEVPAYTRAR